MKYLLLIAALFLFSCGPTYVKHPIDVEINKDGSFVRYSRYVARRVWDEHDNTFNVPAIAEGPVEAKDSLLKLLDKRADSLIQLYKKLVNE